MSVVLGWRSFHYLWSIYGSTSRFVRRDFHREEMENYLGFGFVTFADMTTTKLVCSTRVFNLHGRKVWNNKRIDEFQNLWYRLNVNEHWNEKKFLLEMKQIPIITNPFVQVCRFFFFLLIELIWLDNNCSSPPPSLPPPTCTNISSCPPSIPYPYGQYRQSSPPMINPLNGWIVNPSIPQLIHPMYNPQQQYGKNKRNSFFFFQRNISWNIFSYISIINIDVE